jgi:hypothetical protein
MAKASGIICQGCGIEAPTKKVCFYQNIGMLVMRTHRKIDGMLCKNCVNKHFWKMTGTTLFLGPWGMISLVVAPIFVINNVVRYLGALGMPAVPADAKVPVLTEQAVAQLQPYMQQIVDRLNKTEPLAAVAMDVGPRAQVTPGQVVKYVVALSKQGLPVPPMAGGPPSLPAGPAEPPTLIAQPQRAVSPPEPPPVEPPQSGIGI